MSGTIELLTNTAAYVSSRWRDATDPQSILASMSLAQADIVIQRDGQAGTASTSYNTSESTPAIVDNGNGVLSIPLTAGDLNFTGFATIIVRPPAAIEQRFRINVLDKLSTARLTDIEADTSELQADWVDGGRLDSILDARMPTDHIAATAGKIDEVALVDTCTANSDMRGTDGALLADSYTAPDNASVAAIKAKTDNLPANPATAESVSAVQDTVDAIEIDVDGIDLSNLAEKTDLTPLALETSVTSLGGRLPATLSSGRMRVDVEAINGDATSAVRQALAAGQVIPGAIDDSNFPPTTTQFESSEITATDFNHYLGRLIVFTSGGLEGQAATIKGYELVSGKGHFTVSVLTSAPANGDNFIIV